MINALDLFSGIGGISLALRDYAKTVLYCENNAYCRQVLTERMKTNELDKAPIWEDVRTLHGKGMRGHIDIITGGFPCQDISVAGHGKGLEGERSGLFYEIIRLAEEINPAFIFLENVPAIRTRGLDVVQRELSARGYDSRWIMLSAEEVGAPHRRERWFCLSTNTSGNNVFIKSGGSSRQSREGKAFIRGDGDKESLANTDEQGLEGWNSRVLQKCSGQRIAGTRSSLGYTESQRLEKPLLQRQPPGESYATDAGWWEALSSIRRVSDGIPHRVDRIKCLGNSVVPLQVKTAFEILLGLR